MNFKNEQNCFRKEAERLQTRVQDFEAKIYAKKVDRTDLQRKYQDSALDGSDAEIKKMKAQLMKIEDELQQMEEHLALIVDGKHNRLQSFLPDAKAAAQVEINECMDRLKAMIGELRMYKAEYLGHVLRLNEAFRSVEEIAAYYDRMATEAGKDERQLVYMPTLNLTSTYSGLDKPIGVFWPPRVRATKKNPHSLDAVGSWSIASHTPAAFLWYQSSFIYANEINY